MSDLFFDQPILNSPYGYRCRRWELGEDGQPTQKIIETRRPARFISSVQKPRYQKTKPQTIEFGLYVDEWRSINNLANTQDWKVAPKTARLLQHWRHQKFSRIRPFFCRIEAIEALIWLTKCKDASAKKAAIENYWLPAVNRFANFGCWAFAESTDVWAMKDEFREVAHGFCGGGNRYDKK